MTNNVILLIYAAGTASTVCGLQNLSKLNSDAGYNRRANYKVGIGLAIIIIGWLLEYSSISF